MKSRTRVARVSASLGMFPVGTRYRLFAKREARARRDERKRLVHWAGCVIAGCASKVCWRNDPHTDELNPVLREPAGVRVPRSLRRLFGGPRVLP